MFQYPYVRISKNNSNNRVLGESSVGSHNCGFGVFKINEEAISKTMERDSKLAYKQTALHEIGHTLGLSHEHQRPDRDEYIFASEKYYEKIPDKQVFFGVKVIKIWFLRIYIPYVWYGTFGKTVGSFDFDSVMLYGNSFELKSKYANLTNGIQHINGIFYTKYNYTLSKTDIRTIKEMYK